jgi:hypothetical protein
LPDEIVKSTIDEEFELLKIKELLNDSVFISEVMEAVIYKYQKKGRGIATFAAIDEIAAHIRNDPKVKKKFKRYKDERYKTATYNCAVLVLREIEINFGEKRTKA